MCMCINYKNKLIRSQYELKKMIGKKNIVFREGNHYESNTCLCVVDPEKTAEKLGCTSKYDDAQKDVIFTPKQ